MRLGSGGSVAPVRAGQCVVSGAVGGGVVDDATDRFARVDTGAIDLAIVVPLGYRWCIGLLFSR